MAIENRSNEDHTRMISKSIFVTNFHDETTSNDIWKVCQTYGTVVDVYIPNRRSKAGKRFSFVQFIRVDNVDRLVGNLFTLWIGQRIARVDIEGVPLHAWSRSTFYKIGSKWGEVMELEASNGDLFARKQLCIKTKQDDVPVAVHCSDDESVKGVEDNNAEASNLNNLEAESDSEAVSDTYVRDNADEQGSENESEVRNSGKDTSLSYPPGFTPEKSTHNNVDQEVQDAKHIQSHGRSEGCSSRILDDAEKLDDRFSSEDRGNGVKHKEGGSILELLDEMIKVGQSMRFSMDGCSKDMEKIIGLQGVHETISAIDVKFLWGNYIFDHILSKSLGNSGGILCTWDPNVFHKEHHIISDNFVALYGTWISNRMKLLVISMYASQSVSSKRMLWRYISSLITRWNGESMVMGDFNEVRRMEERWGSTFNAQGASVFNSFITSLGLIDVQLEGYSFTWAHPSASKMSKLDRFLVTDGDFMQKAKVRWAIEGDENSKFFHGIINRKRANLSVNGIMVDGEWVDEPNRVKDEFRIHFATRFQDLGNSRGRLNFNFPNRLNLEQVSDLESMVSRDEIRNAVWGCGENKSPGPDGFTFEFFRKFWTVVGPDFCTAVEWFFDHGSFFIGCNSSFIALIPKSLDPKVVSDYRPISLIGSLYKVVTKILAIRLSTIISDLILDVQTAFLPNRQILGGPFIINEILSRCKQKNQHAMVATKSLVLLLLVDFSLGHFLFTIAIEICQRRFLHYFHLGRALTWWNTLVQTQGRAAAIAQSWEDFKKLLMEEYCTDNEVEKLESEFWNHKMVGSDIDGYTIRFHELARLVPYMVTPKSQCVNRYIRGLAPEIKAHVTSSQPATIQGAVSVANRLTTDDIKDGIFKKKENAGNKKRSNNQNRNRGRGERNKRQRTGSNFALTTPDQGQGQR
nr:RNA-directed DNA polymerase, eukaryota [Tanacetum cinerariifolium]